MQQFLGATPSSVFAERWVVAEARRSAATEDAAAVADVTFIDFGGVAGRGAGRSARAGALGYRARPGDGDAAY